MTLPASKSQMSDFGDIHHATMGCISDFEACLSIKPLMKEGWAESRLADLNLWASGVGAVASPDVSLDQRLQFQPKPRLVLINLLLTLREFISRCRMLVLNETDDKMEIDSIGESEAAPVSPAESTLELCLGGDSDPTPSSMSWFKALAYSQKIASDTFTDPDAKDELDDLHSEVTLKEVMKDIDDILDQLIMLGFAIRKSGTVARLRKADSSFEPNENKDLQKHLEFILLNNAVRRQKESKDDVENTSKGKMQEVTPEQQHLILANLRRRHRFQYARRHQQKLDQLTAHPLVPLVQTAEEHQEMTAGLNRSPAANDGKLPPTDDFPSTTPLQAPEMSATTPSLAEGDILQKATPTAAAASRVSVPVATMHYPLPPPTSQQIMGFKCPCCYQTLPEMFKNWSRWRNHLAEDLCPYTCPFLECPRPEVLYITQAAWREHVLQIHGTAIWECLACIGTGLPNTFSSAEGFVSHNLTEHIGTISQDQITVLQDTCRRMVPPNIAQCPLCPWPQDEKEIPDSVANLEHVGNCIHEFSLNALPWAESLVMDATDPSNSASREKVEEWPKSTEEQESADIQKINIKKFDFFPTQPLPIKQECVYIPEEYFAESSMEPSEVEPGSLSLDSGLPEVRGTCSDNISDKPSENFGIEDHGLLLKETGLGVILDEASEGAGIDDHGLPLKEMAKFVCITQRRGGAEVRVGWEDEIPRWRRGSELSYVVCVESFPATLSNVVEGAMKAATTIWQGIGASFKQVPRENPATFAIVYKNSNRKAYACSFFPNEQSRELIIYPLCLEKPECLINILAHEIGHILGLQHKFTHTQKAEIKYPSVLFGAENALSVMNDFKHPEQLQVQEQDLEELKSFYEYGQTEYNGLPICDIDPGVRPLGIDTTTRKSSHRLLPSCTDILSLISSMLCMILMLLIFISFLLLG